MSNEMREILFNCEVIGNIHDNREVLEETPTADVVEVVRCKDCFFYQKDKELAKANYLDPEKYCALLICEIDKNGFCSYGKKNGR